MLAQSTASTCDNHFEEFHYLTPDLGGTSTTKDVTKSILEKIKLLN